MANLQTFERTEYQQVKADLHRKILDRLDLEKLGRTPSDAARGRSAAADPQAPSTARRCRSASPSASACRGKFWTKSSASGPLEPLLKDPTISDILVNRYDKVYVERAGQA